MMTTLSFLSSLCKILKILILIEKFMISVRIIFFNYLNFNDIILDSTCRDTNLDNMHLTILICMRPSRSSGVKVMATQGQGEGHIPSRSLH